jgi:hypothetical protein
MRCEHLRLTPHALRFHRFAVGEAGSRSPVMGVFPAQQKRSDGPGQRDESSPSFYRVRATPPCPKLPHHPALVSCDDAKVKTVPSFSATISRPVSW